MNKTIIININGIIFHIEEEAYAVLQNYMVGVKRHFGNSVDSNEIVNDIENRIAEMFSERLTPQKAVIQMADVREVCAQMGQVEDFELEDESTEGFDKESFDGYEENRSFFRDPEDKVLGGVCSGLGYYFDIEAKWMRLIFLIIFLFAGTGLLVYIVLWIAIPKAKNRADRMRMRGQSPTIENFKRNFKEEMGDVKNNLKERGERIKNDFNDPNSSTSAMVDNSGKIGMSILKVLGAILIFILVLTLIGLIIGLFIGGSLWSNLGLFPSEFFTDQTRNGLLIAGFFTIVIPILLLILLLIRVIFNKQVMNTRFAVILFISWLIAIGLSTYYFSRVAFSFVENEEISQHFFEDGETSFKFNLFGIPFLSSDGARSYNISNKIVTKSLEPQFTFRLKLLTDKNSTTSYNSDSLNRSMHILGNRVSLLIEPSDKDKNPKLIQLISIKDKSRKSKKHQSKGNDLYNYSIEQENEILWFPSSRTISEQLLNDNLEMRVRLSFPVGTRIIVSNTFENEVEILKFSNSECKNSHNTQTNETQWMMTENGLVCLDDPTTLSPPVDSLPKDSV